MTERIQNRIARQQAPVFQTFGGAMADRLISALVNSRHVSWPNQKYQRDPVLFFREILGIDPWDRQIEVLEAIRDHRRVAVSGGRKVSKSCNIGGGSLWAYCSFEKAKVFLTSSVNRQVDSILWLELRQLYAQAGVCLDCKIRRSEQGKGGRRPCEHSTVIDGVLNKKAASGLESADFRMVTGFAASDGVANQGMSGVNQFYFTDESTGIDDEIFHAILGNCAGGGRVAMFSNPTRLDGFFHDAFEQGSSFHCITIPSTDSPNVKAGRMVIPGLADREYVEDAKRDWGEKSSLYAVHVLGQFPRHETGKIINLHMIDASQKAWVAWVDAMADDPSIQDEGRLYLGVDCAGATGKGDDSTFAVRRGKRILSLTAQSGLTEDAHIIHILGLISEYRTNPREEVPVVVLDRDGDIGWKVHQKVQEYLARHPGQFIYQPFRGSDAPRQPEVYGTTRDELWANLERWLREGGMVPPDLKLAKELHAPSWLIPSGDRERMKVTPKKELRKILGRSTDRADAVGMACYEASPLALGYAIPSPHNQQAAQTATPYDWERSMDPYRGMDLLERNQ